MVKTDLCSWGWPGPPEESCHQWGLVVLCFECEAERLDRQLVPITPSWLVSPPPHLPKWGLACKGCWWLRVQGDLPTHGRLRLLLAKVGLGQRAEVLVHPADLVQKRDWTELLRSLFTKRVTGANHSGHSLQKEQLEQITPVALNKKNETKLLPLLVL